METKKMPKNTETKKIRKNTEPKKMPVSSSGVKHKTFIWRGIKHRWITRNHRIRQLGSYVTNGAQGMGTANHAANSGSAGDTGEFNIPYTELTTNDASSQSGYVRIRIDGREDEKRKGTKHVSIDAHDDMENLQNYIALLNGFDLEKSDKETKKLVEIKIKLSNLQYANGKLSFDINWELKMNCSSMECVMGKKRVVYDLRVDYLLIGGNSTEFRYTNDSVEHSYDWNKKNELTIAGNMMQSTLVASPDHPAHPKNDGTVGIRGFIIQLDDEHHMKELIVRVRDINYDNSKFSADYKADCLFKQWGDAPMAVGAYKDQGRAEKMKIWTTLLQFGNADANEVWVDGKVTRDNPHKEIPISF